MKGYAKRLETAYKSEIQALTANMSQIYDQVHRDVGAVSSHQEAQDRVVEQ